MQTQVNVNSGKSGQMKIQQMAFMLIALAIFFVLVGLFVTQLMFAGLKSSKEALDEENTFKLLSSLSDSPEFSCQNAFFGRDMTSCVDFDKIMALKTVSDNYKDFWGVSNIEVRVLEKDFTGSVECTKTTYPNCNYVKIITAKGVGGYDHSTFVSLCRKAAFDGSFYDKCEMAKLIVRFSSDE